MVVRTWVRLASSLCLGMATTACSIHNRPKRQYAGQLTSSVPSCPTTRGTLIVQRGDVVFTPADGIWILEGKVTGTTVTASRSGSGVDHKPFSTQLTATLTETHVGGTYVTPTCSYSVDLARF